MSKYAFLFCLVPKYPACVKSFYNITVW